VTVVADASPLIALAQVDQLPLLEQLFGEILVPPAVAREVELSLACPSSASSESCSPRNRRA
jgi:predicted nucleic acid-binding protein